MEKLKIIKGKVIHLQIIIGVRNTLIILMYIVIQWRKKQNCWFLQCCRCYLCRYFKKIVKRLGNWKPRRRINRRRRVMTVIMENLYQGGPCSINPKRRQHSITWNMSLVSSATEIRDAFQILWRESPNKSTKILRLLETSRTEGIWSNCCQSICSSLED